MTQLALKNKETGKIYPIVKWDKSANQITLKGENSQFDVEFDKDNLKEMGYTLVQVAPPPSDDDEE